MTDSELLEQVNRAITAALSGQAYSFAGRSVTRADLRMLYDMRKDLQMRTSRGGINIGQAVLS